MTGPSFNPACRACPRLAAFLDEVQAKHPDFHCAPVAPFGAARPRLLIVGLAPGLRGANASGRPFTGDHAGIILYRELHAHGFASQPQSTGADDDLELLDCRITNAVKCLPPANKPNGAEIRTCNPFLANEIATLDRPAVLLALGRIAHEAVLRAVGLRLREVPFSHGGEGEVAAGLRLLSSYHCSRYNTQTGRLTEVMFAKVIARAAELIRQPATK